MWQVVPGDEEVFAGADQVLAKLSLAADIADTFTGLSLHPSLLDSALQTSTSFMMNSGEHSTPFPAALKELEIFGECTAVMWAVARSREGNQAGFDMDLCDEHGMVRVRLKGYTLRILEEAITPVTVKKLMFKAE